MIGEAGHMKYDRFIKAALSGLAIAFASVPAGSHAETLQVLRGAPSSALQVPMNRAVVVESDTPFAELSIANPGIADICDVAEHQLKLGNRHSCKSQHRSLWAQTRHSGTGGVQARDTVRASSGPVC